MTGSGKGGERFVIFFESPVDDAAGVYEGLITDSDPGYKLETSAIVQKELLRRIQEWIFAEAETQPIHHEEPERSPFDLLIFEGAPRRRSTRTLVGMATKYFNRFASIISSAPERFHRIDIPRDTDPWNWESIRRHLEESHIISLITNTRRLALLPHSTVRENTVRLFQLLSTTGVANLGSHERGHLTRWETASPLPGTMLTSIEDLTARPAESDGLEAEEESDIIWSAVADTWDRCIEELRTLRSDLQKLQQSLDQGGQ